MNLILFNNTEFSVQGSQVSGFLPRRDERAVHLLKVLHKDIGSSFDAGIPGG